MSKFKRIPKATDETLDLASRPETHQAAEPAPAPEPAAPEKRKIGRPAEGVMGFGTRLKPETIADIKAVKTGLRLKSEGEAIGRAVEFYRAYLIAKTRRELNLAETMDDDTVLSKSFRVDD